MRQSTYVKPMVVLSGHVIARYPSGIARYPSGIVISGYLTRYENISPNFRDSHEFSANFRSFHFSERQNKDGCAHKHKESETFFTLWSISDL